MLEDHIGELRGLSVGPGYHPVQCKCEVELSRPDTDLLKSSDATHNSSALRPVR